MIIKFLLYGLIGWAGEILFTGAGSVMSGSLKLSGHTYLWMFPIYGLAVFLEPIHKQIRRSPWIIRGIIWACIIFFIEYFSGLILKLSIGLCPWDYSTISRFTEDGFIRLDYFPVWFLAGLIYERIDDFLNRIQIIYLYPSNQVNSQHAAKIILKDGRDWLEILLTEWLKNARDSIMASSKFIFTKSFLSGSSSNRKLIK
jgi:Predicted membrane protein